MILVLAPQCADPARPKPQWGILVMIESISAITLATHNMSRAVSFYRMLGFEIVHGGDDASFTSFRAGTNYLNLIAQPTERNWSWWRRVIFYHPTLTLSMRAWLRPGTVQIRHRKMPNGANGSSTSPTRMVTNLASLGRGDSERPMTPWHLR
jgi:hypothetical protein